MLWAARIRGPSEPHYLCHSQNCLQCRTKSTSVSLVFSSAVTHCHSLCTNVGLRVSERLERLMHDPLDLKWWDQNSGSGIVKPNTDFARVFLPTPGQSVWIQIFNSPCTSVKRAWACCPASGGTDRLDPVLSDLLSVKRDSAWFEALPLMARKHSLRARGWQPMNLSNLKGTLKERSCFPLIYSVWSAIQHCHNLRKRRTARCWGSYW